MSRRDRYLGIFRQTNGTTVRLDFYAVSREDALDHAYHLARDRHDTGPLTVLVVRKLRRGEHFNLDTVSQ